MAVGKYKEWLEPDNLLRLEAWARDGLTDEQIAHNMGINVATLYRYKKDYSNICNALKKGKEVADSEVENALRKRALGFSYNEVTSESKFNETTGEYDLAITKIVKKEVVPDTTAQIFWLKNRRPDVWRDRTEQKITAEGAIQIISDVIPNDDS